MAMAANKVPGVRAAACTDAFTARMSREHNDANVLAIGGRILDRKKALEIVRIFLETPFAGDRHQRRIDKITNLERR
jgi:ribose 5-phosphate isomerase B